MHVEGGSGGRCGGGGDGEGEEVETPHRRAEGGRRTSACRVGEDKGIKEINVY